MTSQIQSNGECSKGVLSTDLAMPDSHWCIPTPMVTVGHIRFVEHIGVGLRRCSLSTCQAFLRASNREASDSTGLHAFLCPYINLFL